MKYKAVASNEAAAVQCTTSGVAWKIKNISLDCVFIKLFFFGNWSVKDQSCFEMSEKT